MPTLLKFSALSSSSLDPKSLPLSSPTDSRAEITLRKAFLTTDSQFQLNVLLLRLKLFARADSKLYPVASSSNILISFFLIATATRLVKEFVIESVALILYVATDVDLPII